MKNISILSHTKSLIICLILFIISHKNAKSQYTTNQEIGILGGGAYYIGDINNTHFNNLQPIAGITYRTNFDRRISFKS